MMVGDESLEQFDLLLMKSAVLDAAVLDAEGCLPGIALREGSLCTPGIYQSLDSIKKTIITDSL